MATTDEIQGLIESLDADLKADEVLAAAMGHSSKLRLKSEVFAFCRQLRDANPSIPHGVRWGGRDENSLRENLESWAAQMAWWARALFLRTIAAAK